jgi:hypothetical protein
MYRDIISEVVELGQEEGTIRKDLYMGLVKRFINGAVDEVINSWIHSGGNTIWSPWPIRWWIFLSGGSVVPVAN